MSATFVAATKALASDPDLFAKVSAAGSPEERAALLTAAGVEVPTHADVNAHVANMAGAAGGTGSATDYAADSATVVVCAASAGAA